MADNVCLRNFVFTLNNYADADIERLRSVLVRFKYIVWGREVGESGTPHLQGFAQLEKVTKFRTVKTLVGERAHIEKMRGTPAQASEYCKKDGQFEEHGELRVMGQRTDISDAVAAICEASSVAQAAQIVPEFVLKYPRGVQVLLEARQPKRDFKPYVVWLWGATGTGKTRTAVDCPSYYIKDNTKWWDGYGHETRIIIDDFDEKCWDLRYLLRLLDRYAFQGETKGGYVQINSREIWITSEFGPDRWYRGTQADQVMRRIDRVTHVSAYIAV